MVGKNKIGVRIAGKDYTLVGTESDEYMQRVALHIDKKMNAVMKANNKLSTSMASVLTAINVADDYFKVCDNMTGLNNELENLKKELEFLKQDNERLSNENAVIGNKNTNYQLELAKREAELKEVRNALEQTTRTRL
ncbi:MAG: cell division protein ZapA [Clostridium sp.]|nr:cell division protein ZapA [Clostridium sp.]